MASRAKRLSGRLKFLLLVAAAYLLAGLIKPALIGEALAGFGAMALKVVPILLLVFVILFLLNLFLRPELLSRHLGTESGLKGWFWAIAAGILISGPPFVLYPMLGEFRKQGVRPALLAVFLYNRNVKIPFLPVMAYYFGLTYTIIVSAYIIVFSVISGKLIEMLVENNRTPDEQRPQLHTLP